MKTCGFRRRQWNFLILATATALAASAMTVRDDGRSGIVGLPSVALPSSCSLASHFQIRCPACGLTRATTEFFHGDWTETQHYHRLGVAFGILVTAQFPYRAWLICLGRSKKVAAESPRLTAGRIAFFRTLDQFVFGAFLVAVFVDWLARAYFGQLQLP